MANSVAPDRNPAGDRLPCNYWRCPRGPPLNLPRSFAGAGGSSTPFRIRLLRGKVCRRSVHGPDDTVASIDEPQPPRIWLLRYIRHALALARYRDECG